MNWKCEEIIMKHMIEKSFIITGISNNLNNSKEFRDIKVYNGLEKWGICWNRRLKLRNNLNLFITFNFSIKI